MHSHRTPLQRARLYAMAIAIGAAPGVLMVVAANFISGEIALDIGVWGILLAIAGVLAGALVVAVLMRDEPEGGRRR